MTYAVIFDMDGVLVDSHRAIWDSHNEVLGKYGVHLSEEDIRRYSGMSLRDDIIDWNKRFGLKLDLAIHSKESWEYQLKILQGMKGDTELVGLLEDLRSHRIPMGVGTSSQKFRTEKILDILRFKPYFPTIVTANDVTLHKPNPDLFLEVAKRLKIESTKCVVVEDAANGIEAAKRGGMKTIGYLNGHNDIDELRGSDLIIRSFSEISFDKIRKLFYD